MFRIERGQRLLFDVDWSIIVFSALTESKDNIFVLKMAARKDDLKRTKGKDCYWND